MQDEKGSEQKLEGSKSLETEASGVVTPASSVEGSTEAGEATKPEMMVKIDGPVGRVFTDALNKLLVQESYMTTDPLFLEVPGKEDDEDVSLQVYCWKGDELNTEDVTQITNEVSRHTTRDFVISVEAARVSPAMGLLSYLEKLPNVKLCLSQEKALAIVSERLRK